MQYRFLLVLTAFLWGCAFVAQRVGMDALGPFGFNGLRFWCGALAILPLVWWSRRFPKSITRRPRPPRLTLPRACLVLGFFLFMGAALQQVGLIYTTAGKAGFITSLYIVVVPLIGLFFNQPLRRSHLAGCIIAMAGVYLLAFHGLDGAINVGDLFELAGVLFWSLHIIFISRYVPYFSGIDLAAGQFFVCGLLNALTMPLVGEPISLSAIAAAAVPLLYCGIFSSGIAFTLQIIAQKHVPPTEASLLCSLEMIFSALAGAILLGELMSCRELVGCLFMTVGIVTAQLPSRIVFSLSLTRHT